MNKEIKELGSMIDSIKEKLTSNEYKEIMDKMMNMDKKIDLYKITYVENNLLPFKCNSKRLVQHFKEAIVQLDLPVEFADSDLERIKMIFRNFIFDNKLSIYRVISHYHGEEEYIYSISNSEDEDEDMDFTLNYSKNLLINIEKYTT